MREAEVIGLLEDIRAKVRGIKYHHTKPRASRHGNTTSACEDIESRTNQALTLLRAKPSAGEQAKELSRLSQLLLAKEKHIKTACDLLDAKDEECEKLKDEIERFKSKYADWEQALGDKPQPKADGF